MVKTAGRSAAVSGILQRRLRHWHRLGRYDVDPQALVNGAEAAALLDRSIPQDVGREWPLGRIAKQALRHHLDARIDEGSDVAAVAAAQAARTVHMEVAHPTMIFRPSERD